MLFIKKTRPSVFQGNLGKKGYFEGWYFKQVSSDGNHILSVIPGISLSSESHSFIQVIDGISGLTDYVSFSLDSFYASEDTFDIKIGDNNFTDKGMQLNLTGESIRLMGSISFNNTVSWKGNLISPGIMGWYSWIPFMECYHDVLSLDHSLEGSLQINDKNVDFSGGRGYIEKDWGRSFPECWIWAQANCFDVPGTSFMISVAKIPWMGHFFIGHLCFFLHSDKLYRFMTWNGTRVHELSHDEHQVNISLSGQKYMLNINVIRTMAGQIKAPVSGSMERYIKESVNATVTVQLTRNNGEMIFTGSSPHAGLEVVGNIFKYLNKKVE
jgi:tocopherol cyclase